MPIRRVKPPDEGDEQLVTFRLQNRLKEGHMRASTCGLLKLPVRTCGVAVVAALLLASCCPADEYWPATAEDAPAQTEPIPWESVVDDNPDEGDGFTMAQSCCPSKPRYHWRDTLSIFVGYEGSKQPQDFGVNAHFGARTAVNWGGPIWQDWGLRFQLGTSINATANAVQVVQRIEGNSARTQSFTTVGIFQRTQSGLTWAVAHDFLYQEYYDEFFLSQWRGRFGWQCGRCDEVGVQCALSGHGNDGNFGAVPLRLQPITQASFYWRHTFPMQAELTGWCGIAEGHSEANIALGDLPRTDEVLAYGSDVFIPLSNYLALFGEANFLTPADTGTVDAYLGIEIFPWGGATGARSHRFSPVLPVANNTSMSVDLYR